MNKKIIIVFIVLVVAIIFLLFKNQLFSRSITTAPQSSPAASQPLSDKPQIVSTKPDPLDDVIIPASQIIEITFNKPLENSGELKVGIDPKADFKIELSSDRKTARILPGKPYELGVTYTMSIGPETKFDSVGRWGEEKVFHFRTIKYRGI